MKDKLYTVSDLVRLFGVSRQTIHNWENNGRFQNSLKVGDKRTLLVPASDVERVRHEEAARLIKDLDRLGFQADPA